jgi:twinkle protein
MEELCLFLFPNGKRDGNKWMVGSIDGSSGGSMSITMSGSAAGRFYDFADKETKGATPLWLWSKAKNVSYKEAVQQAAEWAGVKADDYGVRRHLKKTYQKPGRDDSVAPVKPSTKVMDYLILQRKLDPAVISKALVCATNDDQAIVFPFIEHDAEGNRDVCVHRKFLKVDRPNGKKESWSTKGTKRPLYGKNLIDDNVSEITICEGEIDALTWHSWGIPAVSVPNGVSDFEWVDIDWDWLSRFERINVSMDMDEPGQQATQEIVKRLGLHRCYIVSLPHKDANEALLAGETRESMLRVISAAKAIEMDEIKRPDDFKGDVVKHFTTDPSLEGWETPWSPTVPWRVRPGEFTVLSGFSGSGKTHGLNHLMLHLVQQGVKVMDASLEIRPGLTLYYMTRCALAKKVATKAEAEACVNWLNDNVLFLDCIGTVSIDRIMAGMEYARKRHGVDVFVIDSLFKCGLNSEDYGAARVFADRLTSFCNNTGAHVILVAHSRKTPSGNEFAVPTKADVAGSSDITNAAFNVIIFWRNKLKKRKLDEAYQNNNTEQASEWIDAPDGKILIDKQRFGGGEEGETHVWYAKDACQFHTTRNRAIPYFSSE